MFESNKALWLCVVCATSACGAKPAAEPEQGAPTSGRERERGSHDGLDVSGLRGTLSADEVQNALEPRMPKLSRCVQKRNGEVEWLAGRMTLEFLVAVDGGVTAVYPSASTMGDRATERCVLDVAKATRFPAPHGGEAEFSWSFEVPLDAEIRAPVDWSAGEGDETVAARGGEARAACGPGPYHVTAYVDTEGKVVAAGVAAGDAAAASNLDCVADAVLGWTFASPGSYAAKLSFGIE